VALPIALTAWDFYFLLAGIIGLYAIHRLSLVEERGAIEPREMVNQVLAETRRSIRNVSSVAGLRAATDVPARCSGTRGCGSGFGAPRRRKHRGDDPG
jgi:hypothetical protein